MQANQHADKKLKVLMLESSPNWGGQEDRLLREAVWLERKGHKVILACPDHAAIIGRAGASGIEAHAVPFRANVDLVGLNSLRKLARRERPDLIHARSSKDAWFAFWFRVVGVPVVRSRHTTLMGNMNSGRKVIYRHGCHRIIAAAEFIAKTLHESLGVTRDRIDVVGECVDLDEFFPGDGSALRSELGIPEKSPLFGIVAMLRGEKGHATFLKAARQVLRTRPDARFAVVGRDTSESKVHRVIQDILAYEFSGFPEPPVILTGFRHDIPQIMRSLDCLVVPSKQEAQTLVIPQAFATGKPAIGSRVGGIPEILSDGETGFLIEPGNAEQLADRMLRIANDPDLARRMGRAGREYAERELSVDVKMQLLLESYRKTIAASGRS